MARNFVVINDPVHKLLRGLTRETPLLACTPARNAAPLYHRVHPDELPPEYYGLAVLHALKGSPLPPGPLPQLQVKPGAREVVLRLVDYFDVVKLDRRCCRDLRLKLQKYGPGMVACELLYFGTGALRARNDDPAEEVHWHIWSRYGRIQPRGELVSATIRALHWHSQPLLYKTRKESFDSTNLIYGDAFGELEQLWERRAETSLLQEVAQSLGQLRVRPEIGAFVHPPLNLPAIMELHVRSQALWNRAPASASTLLRRVEYILGHATLENCPKTIFRFPSKATTEPTRPGAGGTGDYDRSGYDGWLPGATEQSD